ncbi:cupin 2 barrel domain protein [Beauveria bassiana ARSEF 2860]|uniref:Cupin 2 barrel domain protein n=1 Tax=Beauveria bassiana (strain ARSEF 2860) TaxID=655819 RepID=J4W2W3_BEAB2|nr:cupin 2 barrel domain protein [Beauveria bassiana ARSEF 2860]EJP64765.1 cupin 2 barrel domain protein [Beauveria bassiana ARSEF 2860]
MATSIPESFKAIADTWAPHLVANVNGQHIKIAKIDGSFVFHSHPDSDELFYVLSGRLTIKFEEGCEAITMEAGDMLLDTYHLVKAVSTVVKAVSTVVKAVSTNPGATA